MAADDRETQRLRVAELARTLYATTLATMTFERWLWLEGWTTVSWYTRDAERVVAYVQMPDAEYHKLNADARAAQRISETELRQRFVADRNAAAWRDAVAAAQIAYGIGGPT